jgi:hypothetical protein
VNVAKADGMEGDNAEIDGLPEIQFFSNRFRIRGQCNAVGYKIPIGENEDKKGVTAESKKAES